MIIPIYEFLEDETAKRELAKSFSIRAEALDIAYSIPGYKAAKLETKNFIYDNIVKVLYKIA